MLDITEMPTGYEVKFEYKPYLVSGIKLIPGSRYTGPVKKTWTVPLESGPALKNWAKNFGVISVNKATVEEIGDIEALPELTINIPLLRNPFPYQNNGIAYAIQKRKCIFGDQPGLGKTGQAIAAAMGLQAKCILVICPATLRENWKREWKIWTGKEVMILRDSVKTSWPQYYKVGMCNVFIVNYESLKKYFVQEIKTPIDEKTGKKKPLQLNHIAFFKTVELFDTVIVDESHRCKESKTFQSKATEAIARTKTNIFALTGTPVVNKPKDLISQLKIINRLQEFGGYMGFTNKYCQGANQASNLKELNWRLHKTCFFRREKRDVLKDLPDKMRNIVRVDITNRAEYNKAENEFITYLKENMHKTDAEAEKSMRGEVMVRMGVLKQIAAKGKLEGVIEYISEIVDAGEKVVIFAWHKEIIRQLKDQFPKAVTITGDDDMKQRQNAVDSFQQDPKVQVIFCNIKSGGVGITLTASSRVGFIEQPWHPADYDQCEDRCHRIGQKGSVQSTNFLGHNTIDEYIYSIIEKKRAIANQVTGAKEQIETNMVNDIINLFMKDKM